MKSEYGPEEWLGRVYQFLRRGEQLTSAAKGTVVKRIGDELMLRFDTVEQCETFLATFISDPIMSSYRTKVAVDFGEAYHLRFLDYLEDDPYGSVVDRCARIAKLAAAGSILCSESYRSQLPKESYFAELCAINLKGFAEQQKIFVHTGSRIGSDYLRPLLEEMNKHVENLDGFRSKGRVLTPSDIQKFSDTSARPFLARELLNLPRYPFSAESIENKIYKEGSLKTEFIGYMVEWEGDISKIDLRQDKLQIEVSVPKARSEVTLIMSSFHREVMIQLKKGDRIRFRGVIEKIFLGIWLNYVDIETVN
jgi:hypothetical protein